MKLGRRSVEHLWSSVRSLITRSPRILLVGAVLGLILIGAMSVRPAVPEARLPAGYRLNALIDRQNQENAQRRAELQELLQALSEKRQKGQDARSTQNEEVEALVRVGAEAGLERVEGSGVVVTLSDGKVPKGGGESANLNNYVIHSADVQAVVNALWGARAQAITVNDQRLVASSSVICVGNTLLVNGTVHAPPYVVKAIGVDRGAYESDSGVRSFMEAVQKYGLGYRVTTHDSLQLEGFDGVTAMRYAQVGYTSSVVTSK